MSKVEQDFEADIFVLAALTEKAMGVRRQTQFAKDCGMSRSYLNQLLKKKLATTPNPKTLIRIARNSNDNVSEEELLRAGGYEPDKYLPKLDLSIMDKYTDDSKESESILYSCTKGALLECPYTNNADIGSLEKYLDEFTISLKKSFLKYWRLVYIDEFHLDMNIRNLDREIHRIISDAYSKIGYDEPFKLSFVTTDRIIYEELCDKKFDSLHICISTILINNQIKGPIFETYLYSGFFNPEYEDEKLDIFNNLTMHYYLMSERIDIKNATAWIHESLVPIDSITSFDNSRHVASWIDPNGKGLDKGKAFFLAKDYVSYLDELEEYVKNPYDELIPACIYDVGTTLQDYQDANNCIILYSK